MNFSHQIIIVIYIALPAIMLVRAVMFARRGRRLPLHRLILLSIGAFLMSGLVCGASASVLGGRMIPRQLLLAGYFSISLLLLLNGFDRLLWVMVRGMFHLHGRPGDSRRLLGFRAFLATLVRAGMLFGIGLPYMLAAAVTYHPHVEFAGDPRTMFGRQFESVRFNSVDGIELAGWWIPADVDHSTATVLLCHGYTGGKETELFLAKQLFNAGYNVFTFDFRAYGNSGGMMTSFGCLERNDVLGAVRWLRGNHAGECHDIDGIGVNTGAAALIAAAADPGAEGQSISALAIYDGFDRLDLELAAIAGNYLPPSLGWLVQRIGLPIAAMQTGAQLSHFAPAELIKALSPRPVLIIHGLEDAIVPFDRGQQLYNSALQPKYKLWIPHAGHQETLNSKPASTEVRHFFNNAMNML